VSKANSLVRGFSQKIGFFLQILFISLMSPGESVHVAWDEERSSKDAIGGGVAQRPILFGNELKKTDARRERARSAAKTHS
jgi:hypothetical protein